MNTNKRLYFYGMKAIAKQLFGIALILIGLFVAPFTHVAVPITFGLIGVVTIFWGKADRFDFQRQSGNIVHAGDGWQR